MASLKGTIALDIDGTLTRDPYFVDPMIIKFLHSVYEKGWNIVLLTGRTFSFSRRALASFETPISIAVQNGATVLFYPSCEVFSEALISKNYFIQLSEILCDQKISFTLESGIKHKDACFFVEKQCLKDDLIYFKYRQSLGQEQWVPLSSIEEYPYDECATVKCFIKGDRLEKVMELFSNLPFNSITIKDPFRPNFTLTLITHPNASKGQIIDLFKQRGHFIIAAGDDYNDFDMLKKADFSIAMEHAPMQIRSLGHIVAQSNPSGLVEALNTALKQFEKRRI